MNTIVVKYTYDSKNCCKTVVIEKKKMDHRKHYILYYVKMEKG